MYITLLLCIVQMMFIIIIIFLCVLFSVQNHIYIWYLYIYELCMIIIYFIFKITYFFYELKDYLPDVPGIGKSRPRPIIQLTPTHTVYKNSVQLFLFCVFHAYEVFFFCPCGVLTYKSAQRSWNTMGCITYYLLIIIIIIIQNYVKQKGEGRSLRHNQLQLSSIHMN